MLYSTHLVWCFYAMATGRWGLFFDRARSPKRAECERVEHPWCGAWHLCEPLSRLPTSAESSPPERQLAEMKRRIPCRHLGLGGGVIASPSSLLCGE